MQAAAFLSQRGPRPWLEPDACRQVYKQHCCMRCIHEADMAGASPTTSGRIAVDQAIKYNSCCSKIRKLVLTSQLLTSERSTYSRGIPVMTAKTSRTNCSQYVWWNWVTKSFFSKEVSISRRRLSPVSAMLRSVCRKAQMMESMTSFSCEADMVNSVAKQ